eukprot:scaffold125314_cov20-Tisochrysis_lutea.AAC.2
MSHELAQVCGVRMKHASEDNTVQTRSNAISAPRPARVPRARIGEIPKASKGRGRKSEAIHAHAHAHTHTHTSICAGAALTSMLFCQHRHMLCL